MSTRSAHNGDEAVYVPSGHDDLAHDLSALGQARRAARAVRDARSRELIRASRDDIRAMYRSGTLKLAPEELVVTTAAEFVSLLARVLKRAEMNASQLAAKTKLPRSQVYSLIKAGRDTLPTKPGQVQLFLVGCGVVAEQVGAIMHTWSKLDEQRQAARAHQASPGPAPEPMTLTAPKPIAEMTPHEIMRLMAQPRRGGTRISDFAVGDITKEMSRPRTWIPIVLTVALIVFMNIMFAERLGLGHNGFATTYIVAVSLLVPMTVSNRVLRWHLVRHCKPSGSSTGKLRRILSSATSR